MSIASRFALASISGLLVLAATPAMSSVGDPRTPGRTASDRAFAAMQRAAGPTLRIERSHSTGLVRHLATSKTRGIAVHSGASADTRALAFLGEYGPAFGLAADTVWVARVSRSDDSGLEHVRLRQHRDGIPVAGGEAIVHLRGAEVMSVLARSAPDLERVSTTPAVGPDVASRAVRARLAKHLGIADAELSAPRLEILSPPLLDGGPWRPSRLSWFVEARTFDRLEYVWIDAETGGVLLNFNQLPSARNRLVFDAQDTAVFESLLVRSEDGPATGDPDADLAYQYSGDTYDYFWTEHGRDSYDDAGATLKSTVHFCPSAEECPYVNAFWNGSRMVYGEGFASADDVVAHELTHAVTSYTARLYYYMQSGALNEAFSDIFGETVDLLNGGDSPDDRWLVGEDLPIGAIRDMMEPNRGWQPASLSDEFFDCGSPGSDHGGVHTNSGVPNRAYSLAADGGSFNGLTVNGIGLAKAGKIQYRVLTEYLVSSSDFADYYDAVNQACTDLVGSSGITAGDCTEVAKALEAVELGDPWPCLPQQSSEPDLCAPGSVPNHLFFDDIDTSLGEGWTVNTSNPNDDNCMWYLSGSFASSGSFSLWAPDTSDTCTVDVRMDSSLSIPASGAALRFDHAFGFEDGSGTYYDGGIIIVSTDGGANWSPADCSSCGGLGYGGTLAAGFDNAMAGEPAFVADSFGYTVSQLDLTPYAGQQVRFGFRVSTDQSDGDYGWWLDDIQAFQCVATQPDGIFADDFESSDASAWSSAVGPQ
jgi:Zn-dependent metalloprotease